MDMNGHDWYGWYGQVRFWASKALSWAAVVFEWPWGQKLGICLLPWHQPAWLFSRDQMRPSKTYLVGGFNPIENMSQIGNLPQLGMNIKNIWNHQLDMFNCNYTVFQHLTSLAPVREVTCTTSNTQRKTNWNCLYRFSIFRVAVKVSTHNLGFFGTCKFNTRFSPSIF